MVLQAGVPPTSVFLYVAFYFGVNNPATNDAIGANNAPRNPPLWMSLRLSWRFKFFEASADIVQDLLTSFFCWRGVTSILFASKFWQISQIVSMNSLSQQCLRICCLPFSEERCNRSSSGVKCLSLRDMFTLQRLNRKWSDFLCASLFIVKYWPS